MRGFFTNKEGAEPDEEANSFGVSDMSFGKNSTEDSSEYGVDEIQNMVCFGSLVFGELVFEEVWVFFC